MADDADINDSDSFDRLEKLAIELQSLSEHEDSDLAKEDHYSKSYETLCSLFMLLFEFTEPGQIKAAERCGKQVVSFLSNKDYYTRTRNDTDASDNDNDDDIKNVQIEIINQSLLIISALCNYDGARYFLIETTPIMNICIERLSALVGNEMELIAMRDKLLSCLSCLIRGFVIQAVEAGILEPIINLLKNTECISDQRGGAAIILSLIEAEKGRVVGARIVLSGAVPLLCETFARDIPTNGSKNENNKNDQAAYRNLQIIGLRCLACILRHQQLARESAMQFFASAKGESHLKSIVEHANATCDVSRWLFAAEILVWLAAEESCYGILGRLGAKQALRKVASEADPYGKWKTLVNQAVSVDVLPALWSSSSIFRKEQHAFLALWMNRYSNGGFDVSYDVEKVRSKICSREWLSFATTLLASPDSVTRRHIHSALQNLYGNTFSMPPRPFSSSSSSLSNNESASISGSANSIPSKIRPGSKFRAKNLDAKGSSSMYDYLLRPIGLARTEELEVIDTLKKAKLPFHILIRPGISLPDIGEVLSKLSPGTRLAVIDSLRELRMKHDEAKRIVLDRALRIKERAIEFPDIKSMLSGENDDEINSNEDPVCFISYCWAQKLKAKALKQILEKHGIKCWMDEQQLEGGSMLFEEIDDGISKCEVIISCLSPEYTKSVNCNREFLLASDRKKATIPVVLEELESWPPRGSLGPLLAGKLYIKMDEHAFGNKEKSTEMRQLVQSVMQLISTASK